MVQLMSENSYLKPSADNMNVTIVGASTTGDQI